LTQLWSLKLFATAIETPLEINFRPGVFHSDLQTLHYHLEDMHTLYLTTEEDIEFPKVLSAKQRLEAKLIGRLRSLPQFNLGSNWGKEWSIVFQNPCYTILLT
jgi:hypothetical protein